MLEPREDGVRDRFASFQNDVADKAVAQNYFDGIFEKIVPFNITTEIERAFPEHSEYFLGQAGSFHILIANRHQSHGGIFIPEDMSRIDRPHDPVLHEMHGAGIDI